MDQSFYIAINALANAATAALLAYATRELKLARAEREDIARHLAEKELADRRRTDRRR